MLETILLSFAALLLLGLGVADPVLTASCALWEVGPEPNLLFDVFVLEPTRGGASELDVSRGFSVFTGSVP